MEYSETLGMDKKIYAKIQDVLGKQLELLSKKQESAHDIDEIIALSHAIVETANALMYPICYQEVARASRRC